MLSKPGPGLLTSVIPLPQRAPRWFITHLTHDGMILFILGLYEFSQEVFAISLLQDGVMVQEYWHEVVVIFHPVYQKGLNSVLVPLLAPATLF